MGGGGGPHREGSGRPLGRRPLKWALKKEPGLGEAEGRGEGGRGGDCKGKGPVWVSSGGHRMPVPSQTYTGAEVAPGRTASAWQHAPGFGVARRALFGSCPGELPPPLCRTAGCGADPRPGAPSHGLQPLSLWVSADGTGDPSCLTSFLHLNLFWFLWEENLIPFSYSFLYPPAHACSLLFWYLPHSSPPALPPCSSAHWLVPVASPPGLPVFLF